MELALIQSLLKKDFYEAHRALTKPAIFSDEANKIKTVLDTAHEEYQRDLTVSELEAVFTTTYPALTTAQRSMFKDRFNEMRSEQPLGWFVLRPMHKTQCVKTTVSGDVMQFFKTY